MGPELNAMTNTDGAETSRAQHHENLFGSVASLHEIINRLEGLRNRIVGAEQPSDPQPNLSSVSTLCLGDVLQQAPEEIRNLRNQMHDMISDIESRLF